MMRDSYPRRWRMRDPKHPRHFTEKFKRQIVGLYHAGKPLRDI